MSSADLNNFMKALDAVKKDYTCGVCGDLCKDPVVLKKCFHIICAGHAGLENCPNCKIPLDESATFIDDRIKICINSAAELDKIFEKFRTKDTTATSSNKTKKIEETKKVTTSNRNVVESGTKIPLSDKTSSRQQLSGTINNSNVSLKSNVNNEKRNKKGETALHVACRLGNIEKVQELINLGANTNTKDNAGWTPLHEAVQIGRLDLVSLLLQHNTLIDVPGQGNETPLHEAVRYNFIDIAEELIKNGADMNLRNYKGETPYQLASVNMKNLLHEAAEKVMYTQSVNISHIAVLYAELELEDVHIYCTSSFRSVHNKLRALTKHHNNIHLEVKFTKKVTHLVVDAEDGVCVSSIDVLQGIVSNIWIISSDWVTKSTEEKLESFEQYEVKGVGTKSCNGPKNARYNKYKQLPGIFNGCHFYLHNFNTKHKVTNSLVLTKAILSKLITDAGGIVLRRVPNPESIPDNEQLVPYHAKKEGKLVDCSHYIIFQELYEPKYNMKHLKALPMGWLIECLEKYELCEPW